MDDEVIELRDQRFESPHLTPVSEVLLRENLKERQVLTVMRSVFSAFGGGGVVASLFIRDGGGRGETIPTESFLKDRVRRFDVAWVGKSIGYINYDNFAPISSTFETATNEDSELCITVYCCVTVICYEYIWN